MNLRELWWELIAARLQALKIALPISLKIEWFIYECDDDVSPCWLRNQLEYIPSITNDWSIIAIEEMPCHELIAFYDKNIL